MSTSHYTLRLAIAATIILLIAAPAQAQKKTQTKGMVDPASLVAKLYGDHFANSQNFERTRKQHRRNFSLELVSLLAADDRLKARHRDEVVGLDFDPLTYSQEMFAGYQVGEAKLERSSATVTVDLWFEGSGPGKHEHDVTVRLTKGRKGWLIADIESGGENLVSILKNPQP